MKYLSRVVWSEGMYLAPHHFQTQSRYFEDSVRFAIEHVWYEPWGLVSYKLDHNAIKNGRVSLLQAQGIFEDGLAFDMPVCDALPPERDVHDLFSPVAESLLVYLAVPTRQSSITNCDLNGASTTRYRAVNRSIRDVYDGSEEKPVQFGQKNIQLIIGSELNPDLQAFPLARVQRDGAGHLIYDPKFIPPCTKLTASDQLFSLLGRLIEVFEEKRNVLVAARSRPGHPQAGANQSEVSNFWFLHTINQGLATLRHLYLSKRSHPEELFCELLQLSGALSTFHVASDPNQLPAYDHRRLDACFEALTCYMLEHLEIMVPGNAVELLLLRTEENFYNAEVKDKRCLGASRWILGLSSSAGEAQVLTRAPQLVKMCSRQFVRELVKRAMPGLALTPLNAPPTAVPSKMEMQYFSVDRSGPCWNHIMDSKQIGIYVPNELPDPRVELYVILES